VTAGLWEAHRDKLTVLDRMYWTHFDRWAKDLAAMDRGEPVRIFGFEIPDCPISEHHKTFVLSPDGSVHIPDLKRSETT